jgi:hypothetical protein
VKRWWANPRIPISPVNKLRAAWIILAFTLIGWPVSLILIDEPPVILSLSWLALSITALDIIATTDVGAEVSD